MSASNVGSAGGPGNRTLRKRVAEGDPTLPVLLDLEQTIAVLGLTKRQIDRLQRSGWLTDIVMLDPAGRRLFRRREVRNLLLLRPNKISRLQTTPRPTTGAQWSFMRCVA